MGLEGVIDARLCEPLFSARLRGAIVLGAGAQAPGAHASPKPPAQQPVFRAGIELVTVDVTALDGNGRQVTDLTATDFQVEVDGDRRQVTSAEYVRSADPLRVIGAPPRSSSPTKRSRRRTPRARRAGG